MAFIVASIIRDVFSILSVNTIIISNKSNLPYFDNYYGRKLYIIELRITVSPFAVIK